MDELPDYARGYVNNPRETFQCELKSWLNIETEDTARTTIAKACLALRNFGGGLLLVGVKDDGSPKPLPQSIQPERMYNRDSIQRIVSAHSGERFQVDVHHVSTANLPHAVAILVPGGLLTPVICKVTTNRDKAPRLQQQLPALAI